MILVTGAGGNVGQELVRELKLRNADYRIASSRKNTDGIYMNFEDPASIEPALSGVTRLFLLRPPHLADAKRYFGPVMDAAVRMGVKQIVFLSVMGADKNQLVPHAKIEALIQKSGIPYTFLRPGFFMQNLLNQHGEELINERTIFVPAGKGKTSFVNVADIGAAAAKVLTEAGHENKAYDLTGSEALNYYEVAELLSAEWNETIKYANPSVPAFWKKMSRKGVKRDFLIVMIGIYMTAKLGMAKRVSPDLECLLGRKPGTFPQYIAKTGRPNFHSTR
ncbi:SDR family oxidoreductase [Paenibacillus sp. URB8-2]|uniref:SDR family oxidoreductase n=1 Tax=Paenibacillus sp. URB8-2 TaxID=2741301 RepID=UPI0015BD5DC2|nr:SDR family oxidoreductase [Paenibacillus sp. URB8-2]BCG57959.1 NAD(P)-dependent oxidoreductase [Paenibacillus sp. URB8-2]